MTQKNEKFPSALEAIFLVILLLGVELLIGLTVQALTPMTGVSVNEAEVVITMLANALIFSALLQYKNLSYADLFHSAKVKVSTTIFLLALPILCIVPALELGLGMLSEVVEAWVPVSVEQQKSFDSMMGNGLQSLVMVCLVAPVLEEMLFRGIILRSFLQQYSRWFAIFGSALLFGLAHMNIYQFVVASILGVMCAWLYEKTRSLLPGIILHAASNTAAIYLYQVTVSRSMLTNWQASIGLYLSFVILASIGIYLLRRLLVTTGSQS